MAMHLLAVLALAAAAEGSPSAPCFGLAEARSAVVLSSQDLLLGLDAGAVLLRTKGECPGLIEADAVHLRPADGGVRFCGAGDAFETGTARCAVAEMVAVQDDGQTCFRSDRMRAWSLTALDRLEVRTREGLFELHLAGSCPELSFSDDLKFRSLRGLREICGGRNDQVIPIAGNMAPGLALQEARSARSVGQPGTSIAQQSGAAATGFACTIRGVRRLAAR